MDKQRKTEYMPPTELAEGESAKDIIVRTIHASIAREFVRANHYSGKTAASSALNFGVYWKGELEGALQYGHPIDKRKSLTLVRDTGWSEFLELNRMVFTQALPRNTESRALSVTLRLIRKNLPQIKWIVSYADATQCGSGTIYRASGFLLTGIKKNQSILYIPAMKETFAKLVFTDLRSHGIYRRVKAVTGVDVIEAMQGGSRITDLISRLDARVLKGYQIRYLKILDPSYQNKINVPILPYSEIDKLDLPEGIK